MSPSFKGKEEGSNNRACPRGDLLLCAEKQMVCSRWVRSGLGAVLGKMITCSFISRDIDKVDELMQDIADQQELAEEISTAISKPVGFGEEFDEVSDSRKATCISGWQTSCSIQQTAQCAHPRVLGWFV